MTRGSPDQQQGVGRAELLEALRRGGGVWGESVFLLIQVVCWHNSLPCSCRTKVLTSSLVVT